MSIQRLTAIAAIIVGFLAPHIKEIPLFADAETLGLVLKGLEYIILSLMVGLLAWFDPAVQERIGRLVNPIIAHWEERRAGRTNPDLRSLAVKMVVENAGELGRLGWILKIPIIGKWLAGSQIDAAASGVKKALKTP